MITKFGVGDVVKTKAQINTIVMGDLDYIKLPRIEIPKGITGEVVYVSNGYQSSEFHVKWREIHCETVECEYSADAMNLVTERMKVTRKPVI